LAALGRDV